MKPAKKVKSIGNLGKAASSTNASTPRARLQHRHPRHIL
jgi:hypothetical protein